MFLLHSRSIPHSPTLTTMVLAVSLPLHNIRQRLRRRSARTSQEPIPTRSARSFMPNVETSGYATATDGQLYKITIPAQGFGSESALIKVELVPSFEEMLRCYREKPQCLTLKEIDDLFFLLRFEDILPTMLCDDSGTGYDHDCQNDKTPSEYSCRICFDPLELKQKVRLLPCNHFFHDRCILNWVLHNNGNCPLCKRNFRSEVGCPEQH